MPEYTLYCFAQSGNAYKPALALELAGADWTPRFVDFFGGETRTPAYLALNAMGEVPVLEHRGRTHSQSGAILDYLAGSLGRYGPRDDDERREILRWLLWDNHKLTSYTATYRFMRALAKDPDPGAMAEFAPAVYLYDNYPGGIGLSRPLFERRDELIAAAVGLVSGCRCGSGCPACVGPILASDEQRSPKGSALRVLALLRMPAGALPAAVAGVRPIASGLH